MLMSHVVEYKFVGGGGSAPVFDENALKYGTYFYSIKKCINIYSATSDS